MGCFLICFLDFAIDLDFGQLLLYIVSAQGNMKVNLIFNFYFPFLLSLNFLMGKLFP